MSSFKLAASLFALLGLSTSDPPNERVLQGWVEADLIFVSPDEQGRVEALKVHEGDQVKKGQVLFLLDDNLQESDLLVKKTAVTNAQQALDRATELLSVASGTRKAFDDAEAAVRQAKANLDWSQTRLSRRNGVSPTGGIVQQVYFRPGETAPPGRPVLSLLPPGNLKIRFFVPETLISRVHYREKVQISCDACAKRLTANVTFIASSAEYTPPVIYSQEERAKLVYLVQAQPADPAAFRVGQPVTVTLPNGAGE
jgi:HlyD family secretion protein